MTDYQKSVLATILAVFMVLPWIALEVLKSLNFYLNGSPVEIDSAYTAIVIPIIVLIFGITTPLGSSVVNGAKKVAKSIGQKEDK